MAQMTAEAQNSSMKDGAEEYKGEA